MHFYITIELLYLPKLTQYGSWRRICSMVFLHQDAEGFTRKIFLFLRFNSTFRNPKSGILNPSI
jgi:hypothetical protein